MCRPGDGAIQVDKGVVHEWRRVSEEDAVSELIVKEWTVPEDGQKEVFFRMLNSFLMEERPSELYDCRVMTPRWMRMWIEKWVVMLQLFIIFWEWDNWPVLVGNGSGLSSWVATHLALWSCSCLGYLLGLKGLYREYVGDELVTKTSKDVVRTPTRKAHTA